MRGGTGGVTRPGGGAGEFVGKRQRRGWGRAEKKMRGGSLVERSTEGGRRLGRWAEARWSVQEGRQFSGRSRGLGSGQVEPVAVLSQGRWGGNRGKGCCCLLSQTVASDHTLGGCWD